MRIKLVEVEIGPDSLPSSEWEVEKDPRLLFAVVHELETMEKWNIHAESEDSTFRAYMDAEGRIKLEIPADVPYCERALYVLARNLEAMARVATEINCWGKVMPGASKKIQPAQMGGVLRL